MPQHYREPATQRKNTGKKVGLIIGIVLFAVGLVCIGIAVWTQFFIKPDIDPPPFQAVDAAVMQTATEAPTEPGSAEKARQYIAGMTTREKICQLFIATPEAITGADSVSMAGDQTKAAIEQYPVGGVIYFSDNLIDAEQVKTMIANTQSYSKTPLFVGVDEEGGTVARCAEKLGTTVFSDMYTYREQGAQTARDNARAIASDIRGFGFNLDFAPVADVWTNPENTVIAERSYSDDYNEAASLVSSAVAGFHEGGVLCSLKHFPGHGDTLEDSHNGLASVGKTADELKSGELLPFKAGIDAGADMVMIGHLTVPALDDKPATLSKVIVPTLLRGNLAYNGVTVTDSMMMGAITENYHFDEIVQGIFDADIDLILCPDNLDAYISAIEQKLSDGSITEEQLDTKLMRILTLKYNRGIM